jgi:hypothetical protein
MAESRQKRKFESVVTLKPVVRKAAVTVAPSLEEITPLHYSKLSARQRKELTLKLIEFLKSF